MKVEDLKSIIDKACLLNNSGNYEESELLSNEVILNLNKLSAEDSQQRSFLLIKAWALFALADTSVRRGSYETMLEKAEFALWFTQENELNEIEPRVYNLIARVYFTINDYEKTLHYLSKALEGNKALGYEAEVANVTSNIGGVYLSLNNFDKALDYFTKSLAINEALGEKIGATQVTGNIGAAYLAFGQNENALEYLFKALAQHQEREEKSSFALVLANIGGAYNNLGEYRKSLEYYNRAIGFFEELGEKLTRASVVLNIGQIYANEDFEDYNPALAEDFLLRASIENKELGAKQNLYSVEKTLAKLYKATNRVAEAYDHLVQYQLIKEEVQSEEATKQSQLLDNRRKVEESERDRQVKLARFQEQEKILYNILPAQIAERILEGEKRIADLHEHVSVFFSDIVGFTKLSQLVTPDELLTMLNEIFSEFDRIARKHGLEKIKTIGDAYMAVAGVPVTQDDHADRAAAFAIDVIEYMKEYRKTTDTDLQIRVGLHCGRAIAGVIVENKFAYDLWGDSVNTASRMESHGEAGRIHVSEDFRNLLAKSSFKFIDRGEMEVKGKGRMRTYFLDNTN